MALNFEMSLDLPETSRKEIHKIIHSINTAKATGPDRIPAKILKMPADKIDRHLGNTRTKDYLKKQLFGNAKTASARLIFKK